MQAPASVIGRLPPPRTVAAAVGLLLCSCAAQAAVSWEEGASDTARRWDATLGFMARYGPEYDGAARQGFSLVPGGAIRHGRVSIASSGVYAVRSPAAGAQGGLQVDLSRGGPWRASLGLRWDGGRKSSESAALQGLGDIRGTLLLRLNASVPLNEHWRVRGTFELDALGRGSGVQGTLGVARSWPLGESLSASLGGTLTWAGGQHMRAYYGITPQQALASGYGVYLPDSGLEQAALSLGLRAPVGRRWTLLGSAGVSRLMGPAAGSPLTRRAGGWSMTVGTVYRF
jgi:outer membrane protein